MTKLFTGLVVFLLYLLFSVVCYLLNGWFIVHLWQWFIVPLGVQTISMPHAIGIGVIISFLTNHPDPKKGQDPDTLSHCIQYILMPLVALFVGWIIQHWM